MSSTAATVYVLGVHVYYLSQQPRWFLIIFYFSVNILRLHGLNLDLISIFSDSGFLSIDCGQEKSYIDTATRLLYVSDSDFVDTGKSYKIPHGMVKLASNEQAYNLRSFPNGTRNCYTLNVARDGKYLVRASFMYANYDTFDKIPSFDIYLDANLWATVNLIESTSHYFYEIIAIATRNQMFVCLVNTRSETPFISSLELRPFDDVHMYSLVLPNQSFTLFKRLNVQPIVHEILRLIAKECFFFFF